jgi:hypothetical protein
MTWLCGVRAVSAFLMAGTAIVSASIVAYFFGWNTATRRHWKMLHHAGSRASGTEK